MLCLLFHDVVPFLSPKLFHDALAFSFTKHQNACPSFLYQLLLYQLLLHQTHGKPTANHLKTPTHHTHKFLNQNPPYPHINRDLLPQTLFLQFPFSLPVPPTTTTTQQVAAATPPPPTTTATHKPP